MPQFRTHLRLIECPIPISIFEEPENQRVFIDHKISKKMIFSQSRVYMIMQGGILMIRVGDQNSI